MGVITDLLLAVPIGIIYNMIVHESSVIFNDKFNYKDKVQRTLLMVFGGGLIGMIVAMFCLSNSIQNTAIKYGLYLGSALLLFHSVIYNWQIMQNDTRIIVMVLTLCVLIWYSYMSNKTETKKEKTKLKDKKKSDDYDYDYDYVNTDGTKLSSLLPMTYEQYKENYTSSNLNTGMDLEMDTDKDFDEIVKLK